MSIHFTSIIKYFKFHLTFAVENSTLVITLRNSDTNEVFLHQKEFIDHPTALWSLSAITLNVKNFSSPDISLPKSHMNWFSELVEIESREPKLYFYQGSTIIKCLSFVISPSSTWCDRKLRESIRNSRKSQMSKSQILVSNMNLLSTTSSSSSISTSNSSSKIVRNLKFPLKLRNSSPKQVFPYIYVEPFGPEELITVVCLNWKSKLCECRILDASTLSQIRSFPIGHCGVYPYFVFCKKTNNFIVGSLVEGRITIFNTENGNSHLSKVLFESNHLQSLRLSHSGLLLACGLPNGMVDIIRTDNLEYVKSFNQGKSNITASCFSKDDTKLYCGDDWGVLTAFSVRTGRMILCKTLHSDAITCMKVYSNDNILFSSSKDKTICLFNLVSNKYEQTLSGFTDSVIHFTYQENYIAGCSADKTIRIFNFDSGDFVQKITNHTDTVGHICFVNYNLYSASLDKHISRYH